MTEKLSFNSGDEEIRAEVEARLRLTLHRFNMTQPQYPTDPKEEERRYNLLQKDPTYNKLGDQFDAATSDQERTQLYMDLSARRALIMTSPTPPKSVR